jgi:hypothetical protein
MTVATDHSSTDNFTITQRVLAILALCARYGVVTTAQIAAADGGSRQTCVRIVQRLVEHGLLKRLGPSHNSLLTGFFDNRPSCLSITRRGLRRLKIAGIAIEATPRRNTTILAHDVEVTQLMFRFNAAVAAHGGVRLIDQPELFLTMPPKTRALARPLRLQVELTPHHFPHLRHLIGEPMTVGLECDRLFALASLADNLGHCLALELDRASEDLSAHRLKGKATFLRKLTAYTACWRAGTFTTQFGAWAKSLRVAVVTTSDSRVDNMLALHSYVGAPPGLFVYTTPARLSEHGPLGPAWRDGKGQTITLIKDRA